jgi:DNA-binding NarL/FixJ family response regulator
MKSREIVLVVDDSPDTVSMLTDVLEEAGVTVLVALDGLQALSLLERVTPDIILMDAVMSGMDGFETTRQLKKNKSLAHVPVIFMTGLSESEHIVRGLEAGGVDYVTKPIVPNELIARMHVHTANARVVQSTQVALDSAGRYLLAINREGRVLWGTPQASKLLGLAFLGSDVEGFQLPAAVPTWLQDCVEAAAGTRTEGMVMTTDFPGLRLNLNFISRVGPDEFLVWLVDGGSGNQELLLKQRLPLTLREAEVLLWIARGKSNRDIGEILGLSPRTVNKHLEHIYNKLGVENRSSAAAVAVRLLGEN